MKNSLGSRARSRRAMLRVILRWAIYAAIMVLFYLFSCNPIIRGFCPLLLIPLATAVAMFEGDLASGIFGMLCGLLMDTANGGSLVGFYALWLLFACPAISLFSRFLIKVNFVSHFVMNVGVSLIIAVLDMLFLHWVWEGTQSVVSFIRVVLPSYIGAVLFSVPIYFLISLVVSKLRPEEHRKLDSSASHTDDGEDKENGN